MIRLRRVLRWALPLTVVLGACVAPPATPEPAALPTEARTPAVGATAATPAALPSASPTVAFIPAVEGTTRVPTLRPNAAFADTRITLKTPAGTGQPSQSWVWETEPFHPDAAYVSKVATTFGVTGPGTLGPALGGSGPWRIWLGEKVLAVSEGDGTVLFFDPKADDGPRPPGAAQMDPAGALERLLSSIGARTADYVPDPSWLGPFRGASSSVSLADTPLDGSWAFSGDPDGAVLFPNYPNPWDPVHLPGARIYDADEMALLTSKGRPVYFAHRPIGRLVGGEVYWVTLFGDAVKELAAAPQRYLRFVSAPTGGKLDLTVDGNDVRHGFAWAETAPGDLTRSRAALVPVWTFLAKGTNASGAPVTAMFVVDAVLPEMRRAPAGRLLNTDADLLTRRQLTVSVGGHRPQLMSPDGAVQDELGACYATATTTMVDVDTASASATCNGAPVSLTVKRAFPGLSGSIWYVSGSQK